jgi:hypothetical protein
LSENNAVETQTQTKAARSAAYLDSIKLRVLVCDLSREHMKLRLPLINVAASGASLAANPSSQQYRREACAAWHELAALIDRHLEQKDDETLANAAERLKLLPHAVAEAMIAACEKLTELAHRISKVDFDHDPADTVGGAGDAMRKFAAALDDFTIREERELLRRLQRILFEHADSHKSS